MINFIAVLLLVSSVALAEAPTPPKVSPQNTSSVTASSKGHKAPAKKSLKKKSPVASTKKLITPRNKGENVSSVESPAEGRSRLSKTSVGLGAVAVGLAAYGAYRLSSKWMRAPGLSGEETAEVLTELVQPPDPYLRRVRELKYRIEEALKNLRTQIVEILKPQVESNEEDVHHAFVAAYVTHFVVTSYWAFEHGDQYKLDRSWSYYARRRADLYSSRSHALGSLGLTLDYARHIGKSCYSSLRDSRAEILNPDSFADRSPQMRQMLEAAFVEEDENTKTRMLREYELLKKLAFYQGLATEPAREYWQDVYLKVYARISPRGHSFHRVSHAIVDHVEAIKNFEHGLLSVEIGEILIPLFGPDGDLVPDIMTRERRP